MSVSQTNKSLSVFAPAKINLYLHITGKQKSGYHTLDSLVVFADIGDQLYIQEASDFQLEIKGQYAGSFIAREKDSSPNSANLVAKAVWELSRAVRKDPRVKVTLVKNLPLAAGIGGGSSDAAAVIWGMMDWWGLSGKPSPFLQDILLGLGADVPVCMHCQPAQVRGIGEVIKDVPPMPEIPVVLAHPSRPCSTQDVFENYNDPYSNPVEMPERWEDKGALFKFLKEQRNDLGRSACELVPEVKMVLKEMERQEGCALARMSGSGATCFGLFGNEMQAMDACEYLVTNYPTWWVRSGTINRPERY